MSQNSPKTVKVFCNVTCCDYRSRQNKGLVVENDKEQKDYTFED